jgi:hypothetical protein
MTKGRWQHLDRVRRPTGSGPPARRTAISPEVGASGTEAQPEPVLSPAARTALQAARGYYHLRQYQACADLLEPLLQEEPRVPDGHRLLGMSLGRVEEPGRAARALAAAVAEAPHDVPLWGSLLSARIQAGIEEEVPSGLSGPAGELAGAATWILGQRSLREGRPAEAARRFAEAAALFEAWSPAELLPERAAACYVGGAVSHLLAAQLDAAQQGFSRLSGRAAVGGPVLAFARQVFEVVEAMRELSPEERAEVLDPLAGLVLRLRLRVRFYDQVRPVAMHWENLP